MQKSSTPKSTTSGKLLLKLAEEHRKMRGLLELVEQGVMTPNAFKLRIKGFSCDPAVEHVVNEIIDAHGAKEESDYA